jgi:hypothetical protein
MGDFMNSTSEIANLIASLSGGRVLVVGDLILDEYLIGRATRLSREAPVPVLEQQHRFTRLGGRRRRRDRPGRSRADASGPARRGGH